MAVQIFRSTDAGAPTYSNVAGCFIAVLDFCLLGLGWTRTVLGTNQVAYTQPSGSNGLVLQVDDSSTTHATLNGYESVSSFNVGVGNFNPGATINLNHGNDASAHSWRLITNGKIFHFTVDWNTGASPHYSDFVTFGDIVSYVPGDAFGTMLAGFTSAGAPYMGWTALNLNLPWNNSSGYAAICRSWNQISSPTLSGNNPVILVDQALIGGSGCSAGSSCPVYPDPISGALNLSPFWIAEGAPSIVRGGIRGLIPGVWCILGKTSSAAPAPFNDGDTFTAGAGPLAGRTFEFVGANGAAYGQVAIETSNTWGGF